MKHLFAILLMLIFYQSNAQYDKNWYVLANDHLTATGLYGDPPDILNNTCYIQKVVHPYRTNNYPYDGAPSNDIFIIFDDGSHFNSRQISRNDWKDGAVNAGSTIQSHYYLHTNKPIEYLYYTNVYEADEEPEALIEPTQDTPNNAVSHKLSMGVNSQLREAMTIPGGAISANHSPVPGKDITLILTHEHINPNCAYKLCYDIPSQNNTALGSTTPLLLMESKVFSAPFLPNSFIMSGGSGINLLTNSLVNQCIDGLTFNSGNYTYINLAIPEDPDSLISNSPINFNLIPIPGLTSTVCPPIPPLTETISNSHDPNYIEVLCVNEPISDNPNTMSTIHYRAQCMNDGEYFQPNPSIEFTLPFNFALSDVTITRSSIATGPPYTDFNPQAPYLYAPTNNRLKFQFFGALDFCPPTSEEERCKAWVEFCVKVKKSEVDVITGDLRPRNRNTNFGDDAYPIIRFIDPCYTCVQPKPDPRGAPNDEDPIKDDSLKIDDISDSSLKNEGARNVPLACCRKNSDCNCRSKIPRCCWYSIVCNNNIQWTTLICFLLFLYLILLFTILFRRSKR